MSDSTASLARSSAGMAAGTIASRALGVVRAALQALAIGTAAAANGWEVANTLPNIVYLLLAGGVLNAVLVPQITRSAAHADGGRDYVDRLLTLAIGGIALVTVLITAAAPLLVRLYAGTLDPATLHLSVTFAFICLPQIFFYGLYTVLGQVLNARGHFAAFFWAPVAANVVFIAGLVAFIVLYPAQPSVADYTAPMIWLLAGSATLSIAAQGLILVAPLWRSGFRFRPRWGFRGVGLRGASTVALWTFAALAVSQLAFIVTSQVLGTVGGNDPGRASYSYAFLVFMLPHSLVTVSLVTALFTKMSRAAHSDNLREVRRDVHQGLRLTAVVNIPASIGGMLLGVYVTGTLYILNSPEATRGIASIMIPMLAGLVPFGVVYLIQRVYYAFEDARTPFRLQVIISVVATVTGLGALLLPDPWIGFGIGVGQTVSNLVGAIVGVIWVRHRLDGLPLGSITRSYVRLTLASLAGAVPAAALAWALTRAIHGRAQGPVVLLVAGGAFAVVYLLIARRLRVREVDELLGPLLGRARRILPGR
jgi:putative peptidoglycan lipid II flippase